MRLTLLLLAVSILLYACSKSTSGSQLLWQCDNVQAFDSTATTTKLTGSWRWLQQRMGWTFEVVPADKTVIVTFNANATFTVTENAVTTTQGNWKLYQYSDSTWALDLTSPSPYLNGYISFCNNKVLFTNSVVDGNDNLFQKAD